jgi:hypothetical protein
LLEIDSATDLLRRLPRPATHLQTQQAKRRRRRAFDDEQRLPALQSAGLPVEEHAAQGRRHDHRQRHRGKRQTDDEAANAARKHCVDVAEDEGAEAVLRYAEHKAIHQKPRLIRHPRLTGSVP